MKTDHIQTVVLFFYFACMDEKRIKSLTKKTLQLLKKKDTDLHPQHKLVFYCHKIWISAKKKIKAKHILLNTNPFIKMNDSINITYWFDFIKESDPEIITPVIFHNILKIPQDDISKGLNISTGTLRYRLSKGISHLGDILGHTE